jgi:hypothetical protein
MSILIVPYVTLGIYALNRAEAPLSGFCSTLAYRRNPARRLHVVKYESLDHNLHSER